MIEPPTLTERWNTCQSLRKSPNLAGQAEKVSQPQRSPSKDVYFFPDSTVLSSHLNFVECESKVATVLFLFLFLFFTWCIAAVVQMESFLSLKCHLIQQTLITSAGLSRQAMSTIVLPVGCLNLITFVFIPFLLCVSCGYYSTRRSPILCL